VYEELYLARAAATVLPSDDNKRTLFGEYLVPTGSEERAFTFNQWLERLADVRPEVRLPGFWATIAENCARWAEELSVGPFWSEISRRLDQWRTEYTGQTGADLLPTVGLPRFVGKPELSIRDKLFRRYGRSLEDCRRAMQDTGPPIPRLGDLVRTRIPCRYIDGVEFLADKIQSVAAEKGIRCSRRREGRISGYFAQHVVVYQEVIFRFGGHNELGLVGSEIQIASEMATRMWDASHSLYELERGDENPEAWQWKPEDPRFISSQLGHVIHLADGLLVQLRATTRGKKA
jgi:hypothetical protein